MTDWLIDSFVKSDIRKFSSDKVVFQNRRLFRDLFSFGVSWVLYKFAIDLIQNLSLRKRFTRQQVPLIFVAVGRHAKIILVGRVLLLRHPSCILCQENLLLFMIEQTRFKSFANTGVVFLMVGKGGYWKLWVVIIIVGTVASDAVVKQMRPIGLRNGFWWLSFNIAGFWNRLARITWVLVVNTEHLQLAYIDVYVDVEHRAWGFLCLFLFVYWTCDTFLCCHL